MVVNPNSIALTGYCRLVRVECKTNIFGSICFLLTDTSLNMIYQDNARSHVSIVTRQKLLKLGWDILPRLPYSAHLPRSDYHLFRPLENYLDNKNLSSMEDCENELRCFFSSKD